MTSSPKSRTTPPKGRPTPTRRASTRRGPGRSTLGWVGLALVIVVILIGAYFVARNQDPNPLNRQQIGPALIIGAGDDVVDAPAVRTRAA